MQNLTFTDAPMKSVPSIESSADVLGLEEAFRKPLPCS